MLSLEVEDDVIQRLAAILDVSPVEVSRRGRAHRVGRDRGGADQVPPWTPIRPTW